jgi:hypothetical protein
LYCFCSTKPCLGFDSGKRVKESFCETRRGVSSLPNVNAEESTDSSRLIVPFAAFIPLRCSTYPRMAALETLCAFIVPK